MVYHLIGQAHSNIRSSPRFQILPIRDIHSVELFSTQRLHQTLLHQHILNPPLPQSEVPGSAKFHYVRKGDRNHSNLCYDTNCCESCNNGKENRRRKTRRTQYTNFTWFGSVPTSIGMTAQNFTITEIGLHRRVFIITLDMIKLQKYPYTLNIHYCTTGASPPYPQPIISSPQQRGYA